MKTRTDTCAPAGGKLPIATKWPLNLKCNAKTLCNCRPTARTQHVRPISNRRRCDFHPHFFLFGSQLWNKLLHNGSNANCNFAKKSWQLDFAWGVISTKLIHVVVYCDQSTLPDLHETFQWRENTLAQHGPLLSIFFFFFFSLLFLRGCQMHNGFSCPRS